MHAGSGLNSLTDWKIRWNHKHKTGFFHRSRRGAIQKSFHGTVIQMHRSISFVPQYSLVRSHSVVSLSQIVSLLRWCLYSHRNKTPRDSNFNYIVCQKRTQKRNRKETDSMEPTTPTWCLRLLRNSNYDTFNFEPFVARLFLQHWNLTAFCC